MKEAGAMKAPFELAHRNTISHDTVEALRSLLAEAERGEVLGLALVVMHKRRSFSVEVTGEADRNPVFTIGTLAMLDEHLRRKAYK